MEDYVGKILGTVTSQELREINGFVIEKTAVRESLNNLLEESVNLERRLEQARMEWWERMKQKYNLPKEKELRKDEVFGQKKIIRISLETGELYIGLEAK